jgi:hypothetical protein
MTLNRITAFMIPLILFGCGRNAVDPLQRAYQDLRSVPRDRWEALAGKKIFFGHHSVGRNILDGLARVMKAEPAVRLNIRETADPAAFTEPVLAHATVGRNRDPLGKIDDFRRLLEGGIGRVADIAFFKLCFVDIDRKTDIEALYAHYERTLSDLAAAFPGLTIIPVTVPLTNHDPGIKARIKRLLGRGPAILADNAVRDRFNTLVREKYGSAVWDLAGAESTTAAGTKVSASDGEGIVLLMNPAYTRDGGHLNAAGSQAVAIDLLIKLAGIAPQRD